MSQEPSQPHPEKHPQTEATWHALSPAQTAEKLGSDSHNGLGEHEAKKRRIKYGLNELRPPETIRWHEILLEQFKSLVVLMLLAATGVAFAVGDYLEGAGVLIVILLNAVIGFVTEFRANRAMEALQKLGTSEATVIRSGQRKSVPAADLVPGDVIVVQEGEAIPADARLVESAELRVEESSLTGEPEAVAKHPEPIDDEELPLADRANMIYKSTHVASGNGQAIVVHTGMASQIGHVSKLVGGIEETETPLKRRLDQLGRKLIVVCLGVALLVFLAGFLQGVEIGQMLLAAIALAIAAVPEGLPAVATITLAVGMKRMARKNALIRSLPAVETLGSVTCICSDKTGTLTRGEMTASKLALPEREVQISGGGYEPEGEFHEAEKSVDPMGDPRLRALLLTGLLCNNSTLQKEEGSWQINGDTTEGALTVAGAKAGLDAPQTRQKYKEIREFAFTSEIMMMATVNEGLAEDFSDGAGRMLCAKGAPDKVLDCCTRIWGPEGVTEMDPDTREKLREENRRLAGEGLRVLAGAYRPLESAPETTEEAYRDLTWIGLFGILDPPRDEVRDTVDLLTRAGIKTVMITGDQPATALRIASELHIAPEVAPVVTGRELARNTPEELAGHIRDVEVFARVSPEQKVDICKALQADGHIVGMLGDGVNDAIALKQADIGVAMGIKGTDVAKETAEMLLLDDRFATVGSAMHQGRVIYANIHKFIHYLFSCNLSEILTMLLASVLFSLTGGWVSPLPLLPLQILWLNIVTDVFPALSLAMEPAEPDVMDHPPRDPDASLLDKPTVISIFGFSGLMTLSTLSAFVLGTWMHGKGQGGVGYPVTMSFMTLAMTQLFHVFNSRNEHGPMRGRQWINNPYILGSLVLVTGLQLLAVYVPILQEMLGTVALEAKDWALIIPLALMPLVVGQAIRWIHPAGLGRAQKAPSRARQEQAV